MPPDLSIPLGVKPVRFDLLGSYRKAQEIRAQEAARQADQEERAEARQERAENRKMRLDTITKRDKIQALVGDGTLTDEKVNRIIGIDYDTGRVMREHLRQAKQQDRDALQQKAEDLGRAFIGVRDQPGYDRALASIAQKGIDTSAFSKQFDPAAVDGYVREGMTWSQLIASMTPKDTGRESLAEYEAKRRIDASYRAPGGGGGESLETYEEKRKIDAKYRAPTATNGADDPTLPQGVKDYLFSMQSKVVTDANNRAVLDANGQPVPYRVQDALADLNAVMPKMKRDHPKLDPIKAQKAVKDLFGEDSLNAVLPEEFGGGAVPTTGRWVEPRLGEEPRLDEDALDAPPDDRPGVQGPQRSRDIALSGSHTVRLPDGRTATFPTAEAAAEATRRLASVSYTRLAAALAQFKAERDPAKQAQIMEQIRMLRAAVEADGGATDPAALSTDDYIDAMNAEEARRQTAPKRKAGDVVTTKNGQRVRITAVNPDGSYAAEPAP